MDGKSLKFIRDLCNLNRLEFAFLLSIREASLASMEAGLSSIPDHVSNTAAILFKARKAQIDKFASSIPSPKFEELMLAFPVEEGSMKPTGQATEITPEEALGQSSIVLAFKKPEKVKAEKPKKEPKPAPNPNHGFNAMDPRTYHLGPKVD